jgi:hypothetical protein
MNPGEIDPLIEQLQDSHDHRAEYAVLSGTDKQGEPTFTLDGDFTLAFLRDLVKLAEDQHPAIKPVAQSSVSIKIELTLCPQEAFWLKALMQNSPPDEGEVEHAVRQAIFDALPPFKALEGL